MHEAKSLASQPAEETVLTMLQIRAWTAKSQMHCLQKLSFVVPLTSLINIVGLDLGDVNRMVDETSDPKLAVQLVDGIADDDDRNQIRPQLVPQP